VKTREEKRVEERVESSIQVVVNDYYELETFE
jgi:hypothetical protein